MSAFGSCQVIVPTSRSAALVLRLTSLPGVVVRSMVCLNMTSQEAGISSEYNAFLDPGHGPVGRLSAGERYRLDVSDKIDTGQSWQLAGFLTHLLFREKRLATDAGIGCALVWATGQVRYDFVVGGVGYVAEKLRVTRPIFEQAVAARRRVFVFVPKANERDLDNEVIDWLRTEGAAVRAIESVDEALTALQLPVLARAATPETSEKRWKGNPYRNLDAFDLVHRAVFFGRGRAREECVIMLRREAGRRCAFLLVHGRSGAGKSSLARAGIAGDVADQAKEGGVFTSAVMTPSIGSDGPLVALADALMAITGRSDRERERFRALLRSNRTEAIGQIERDLRRGGQKNSGLIILDQMEEIFAEEALHPDTEAFGVALESLAKRCIVWVVATLRSDYIADLDRVPSLARLASAERTYRLDRPTRYELFEMITAPAALAAIDFEAPKIGPSLPDALTDIAAQSPDSLPLLQVVLTRLYEQLGKDRKLTYESYERIGKFEGAISQWAEEEVDAIRKSGASQRFIDQSLIGLVCIDDGRLTSRPLAMREQQKDVVNLIHKLVAARLVSLDSQNCAPTARLAHDALLNSWTHIRSLAASIGRYIILRDQLILNSSLWYSNGCRRENLILSTGQLDEASSFLRQDLIEVPEAVIRFVNASLRHKRFNIRRLWFLGSVAFLIIFLYLSIPRLEVAAVFSIANLENKNVNKEANVRVKLINNGLMNLNNIYIICDPWTFVDSHPGNPSNLANIRLIGNFSPFSLGSGATIYSGPTCSFSPSDLPVRVIVSYEWPLIGALLDLRIKTYTIRLTRS